MGHGKLHKCERRRVKDDSLHSILVRHTPRWTNFLTADRPSSSGTPIDTKEVDLSGVVSFLVWLVEPARRECAKNCGNILPELRSIPRKRINQGDKPQNRGNVDKVEFRSLRHDEDGKMWHEGNLFTGLAVEYWPNGVVAS